MKDYERTSREATQAASERIASSVPAEVSDAASPGLSAAPTESAGPSRIPRARWPGTRRFLSTGRARWVVAAAVICAAIGVPVGVATSPSSAGAAPPAGSRPGVAGHSGSSGGGSNARSGPAAGGAVGTVGTVSATGFTLSTPAGESVTVDETSTTTYANGSTSTSAAAPTTGADVLVLGTTSGTTITATQVSTQPSGGSTAATAATVVPFEQGSPTTSKQAGQIPANYTEGSGTIVEGTAANQATTVALAAYPGGVVDRVVKLSNGEYEVHNIGVNWPHHIFVSQNFKVVGAD
jgi:hypothetical protein